MKKTLGVVVALIVLLGSIYPLQASAAWWNPFSWSFGKKATVEKLSTTTQAAIPAAPSSTTPVAPKETAPIKTTTSTAPVAPTTPAAPITKAAAQATTGQSTLSEKDKTEIGVLVKMFVYAIRNKQGEVANSLVANQSKVYFDQVLNLARTASKQTLLSQDFATTLSVIVTRIIAASSTLDIKGSDIITQSVNLAAPVAELDMSKLALDFKSVKKDVVEVSAKHEGKLILKSNTIKENGTWKIDYASMFTAKNEEIEKQVQKQVAQSGKTRAEIYQILIEFLFQGYNPDNAYFIWVPLNERGDLKAENATFQGFSDMENGYSLLFPNYWEASPEDYTMFFLAPYTTDGLRSSIAITPNSDLQGRNIDSYMQDMVRELPANKPDMVSGSLTSEKTMFQNQPAYRVKYKRLRTFDGGRTYITQIIDSLTFFGNNRAFLIEYRNSIASYDIEKPLADRIINSFKIEAPCTTSPCTSYSR